MGQNNSLTLKSTQSVSMPIRDKLNKNKISQKRDYKQSEKIYDYLFNLPIEYCEICFDKIGAKAFHEVSKFFETFRENIPFLGQKYFYHAYIIIGVYMNDRVRKGRNVKYFLVEYGGYPSSEQVYKYYTKYEYGEEGGLRYTLVDPKYYDELKQDYYIILDVNNIYSPRNLIDLCKKESVWTKDKYDLANHNCQDFASLILKFLNCKRAPNEDNRGLHSLSKTKIPGPVLKQLEKNENDKISIVGNFPIIGNAYDHIVEFKRSIEDMRSIRSGTWNRRKYNMIKKETKCFWCGELKEENFTVKKLEEGTIEICFRCFSFIFENNIEEPSFHEHILEPQLKKSFFCKECKQPFFYNIAYYCKNCNYSFCFTCTNKSCNISLSYKEKSISKDEKIQFIKIKKYFNCDLLDELGNYLTKEDYRKIFYEYYDEENTPDLGEEYTEKHSEYQEEILKEKKKDEDIFSILLNENRDN